MITEGSPKKRRWVCLTFLGGCETCDHRSRSRGLRSYSTTSICCRFPVQLAPQQICTAKEKHNKFNKWSSSNYRLRVRVYHHIPNSQQVALFLMVTIIISFVYCWQPSFFAQYTYDAVYLYLMAVNKTISSGGDYRDSKQIMQSAKGITFTGEWSFQPILLPLSRRQ